MQSGTKLRIYFHNNLAEDSVIHPHGLRVPEDCDGQPMQAIGPGETKIYEFQVIDRAGPLLVPSPPAYAHRRAGADGPGRAVLRHRCG